MQLGFWQRQGISSVVDIVVDSAITTILSKNGKKMPMPKTTFGKVVGSLGMFVGGAVISGVGAYMLEAAGEEEDEDGNRR